MKSISTWATYCGALVSAMHFIKRKRLPQESSFFRIPHPAEILRPAPKTHHPLFPSIPIPIPSIPIPSIPSTPSFSPTILIENPPVFLYNESKYRNNKMCAGRILESINPGEFNLPDPQIRKEVTL